MARRRNKENAGLPARWRLYHGAFYYRVPKGLEHLWDGKRQYRLGKTLTEAYRVWAEHMGVDEHDVRTLGAAFDRYLLEVVPTKVPKTQAENARPARFERATAWFVA